MKKQFILASAVAMLSLSGLSSAATLVINGTGLGVLSTGERAVKIVGAETNYITDTFDFKLSANVTMTMFQDVDGAAAAAGTFKGTDAVFGGSTVDGVGVFDCVTKELAADTVLTVIAATNAPCVAGS